MTSTRYTSRAIQDVELELAKVGKGLATKAGTLLAKGYRPELDRSDELDPRRLTYYQGLIGVLSWICKLGRLDILMPVSLMSRYLVSAREGQLEQGVSHLCIPQAPQEVYDGVRLHRAQI